MANKGAHHEELRRAPSDTVGSDRSFGVVFAAVFAVVGLLPLAHGGPWRPWALIVAGAFLVVALAVPRILRPANLVWHRFGLLLHHVTTPVILALVFAVAVVPTGLVMRLLGKDPMQRRFEPDADTYWVRHNPPGPERETMKNQF